METLLKIRDEVAPLVELDFFLNEDNLNAQHKEDEIARVIHGKNYDKTRKRIDEFVARCNQTLGGLEDRANQLKNEYDGLVRQAESQHPGKPPSDWNVDKNDYNSVAKYNEKVERYNNKLDAYRRICDQAERAKDRVQDAISKYNDKKADLDEQVREKMEELIPALDQDIVAVLGNLQKAAYDNVHVKNNVFSGFLMNFLSRRVYEMLSDRIHDSSARQSANQVSKQLNDEMDALVSQHDREVKEGLTGHASFLSSHFQGNNVILDGIQTKLRELPYNECSEYEPKIKKLLATDLSTAFEYKNIIDPAEMGRVEQQVQGRRSDIEKQIQSCDELTMGLTPIFDGIQTTKNMVHGELEKMHENKSAHLDPVWYELMFILSVFDENDRERYFTKQKGWLEDVQKGIESELKVDLAKLVKDTVETELLTVSAQDLLSRDAAFAFLENRSKLAAKKQALVEGAQTLSKSLGEIGELPKQKAEEFKKSVSAPLALSFLPVLNLGLLISVLGKIKKFLPGLSSANSHFIEARKAVTGKMRTVAFIELALLVICVLGSFFVGPSGRIALYVLAATYLISGLVLYLKHVQLKKIEDSRGEAEPTPAT